MYANALSESIVSHVTHFIYTTQEKNAAVSFGMTLTFHSSIRGDLSTSLGTCFVVVAIDPLVSELLHTFTTCTFCPATILELSVAVSETYVGLESGICKQICN